MAIINVENLVKEYSKGKRALDDIFPWMKVKCTDFWDQMELENLP